MPHFIPLFWWTFAYLLTGWHHFPLSLPSHEESRSNQDVIKHHQWGQIKDYYPQWEMYFPVMFHWDVFIISSWTTLVENRCHHLIFPAMCTFSCWATRADNKDAAPQQGKHGTTGQFPHLPSLCIVSFTAHIWVTVRHGLLPSCLCKCCRNAHQFFCLQTMGKHFIYTCCPPGQDPKWAQFLIQQNTPTGSNQGYFFTVWGSTHIPHPKYWNIKKLLPKSLSKTW